MEITRNKQKIRVALFALCAAVLSCTHFSEEEFAVVERSKFKRPNWADLELGQTIEDDRRFRFVSESAPNVILPNAVKEAQLTTLERGSVSFGATLSEKLSRFSGKRKIEIGARDTMAKISLGHFEDYYDAQARVSDIYYERILSSRAQPGDPEQYRVYVLVEFQKTHLPQLWHDLGVKLRRAGPGDLKELGRALQQAKPNQLAH